MFLKIATINFWGLPWPGSVQKNKRLDLLIKFLKQEKPHIVCLQEIWLVSDLIFLKNNLFEYNFIYEIKRKKNPSGLVILTQIPVKKYFYIPFNTLSYEVSFKKGLLLSKFDDFRVINTHFYATLFPLKSKIWKKQLEKLYSAIGTKKTIICGDFNYHYPNFPFPDLYLISQSNFHTRDTSNPYNKKALNKISKINMICDLIYTNFETEVIEKRIIKKPLISDHYPVLSTIKL